MKITLAFVPLLILGIMIGWGFVIGKRNVIIRSIGILVSFVAALISVFFVKGVGYSSVEPMLETLLSNTEIGESITDFLGSAQSIGDTLMSVCTAFVAPIVFFMVFIAFSVITWIIGWIVSLIMMCVSPAGGKKRSPAVIIPCVIAQALLTLFVILTPISAYGSSVTAILYRADQLEGDSPLAESEAFEVIEVIEDANDSVAVSAYRTLGGKAFCNMLTSFKINGEKSNLMYEADAIGRIAADVLYLSGNKLVDYGSDEAEAIKDIGEGLSDSVILPTLFGEFIYSATDKWLDGESFFGMSAPDLEGMGAEIFDEAFEHLIEVFHRDARDRDALCKHFETLANTVAILAEDGVFSAMGMEGNALIDKLSSGETVRKLIDTFGSNDGFKVLIGDVTNIGMRAIGSALSIPENAEEVYSDFTGSIAEKLTYVNNSEMSEDEKCDELASVIKESFTNSGVTAELDDEVVKLYAKMILEDFGSAGEVTSEDIAEFFRAYSEVSRALDPNGAKLEADAGAIKLLSGGSDYTNDAYAGKSAEELQSTSGAGILAVIMNEILAAEESGNCTDEDIRRIIEDALVEFARTAGKDEELAREFAQSISIEATKITQELIAATENMRSAETMAETSELVTIADLLVDPEGLAAALDSKEAVEKEAEAIGKVFSSVAEISGLIGEGNGEEGKGLSDVAEGLGNILDGLSETSSVGADNTSKLMTAVMQSETVRNAADLDMATATELAKAATESENGKVNYTETMVGIAAGAGVAEKLADENAELTREDIRELLDSMNPQTAKVLKTYMNEKRVAGFGVPAEKVPTSTEMINNLLDEMGDKDKYADTYESEIDGISTLFDLLNAATAKNAEGKPIFNHGDEVGRLNSDAYSFMSTILGSDMVCNALDKSLNKDGGVVNDPFGLNLDENGRDYIAASEALDKLYGETADDRVNLIAALFGIER